MAGRRPAASSEFHGLAIARECFHQTVCQQYQHDGARAADEVCRFVQSALYVWSVDRAGRQKPIRSGYFASTSCCGVGLVGRAPGLLAVAAS